jgi:hypothetical protein
VSGSGPDIDGARALAVPGELEHFFDDDLGFGTGDEDVGRDLEVAHPELADAGDLRDRFARCPAFDECGVGRGESLRFVLAHAGEQRRAVPAECMPREHLGIERSVGRIETGRFEALPRRGETLGDRGHQDAVSAAVASLSFSELK